MESLRGTGASQALKIRRAHPARSTQASCSKGMSSPSAAWISHHPTASSHSWAPYPSPSTPYCLGSLATPDIPPDSSVFVCPAVHTGAYPGQSRSSNGYDLLIAVGSSATSPSHPGRIQHGQRAAEGGCDPSVANGVHVFTATVPATIQCMRPP